MDKIENPHKLALWDGRKKKQQAKADGLNPVKEEKDKDDIPKLDDIDPENVEYVEPEPLPMSKMEAKLDRYAKEKTGDAIQKVKTPHAEPEDAKPVHTIETLAALNPKYVAPLDVNGIPLTRNVDPIRSVKGLRIARKNRITKTKDGWIVPGDGKKTYDVTAINGIFECNCEDFKNTANVCKHIHAVWAIEEGVKIPSVQVLDKQLKLLKESEKAYSKSWHVYNKVQCEETAVFLQILKEVCDSIDDPYKNKMGRPRIPLNDVIFAATYKVYSTMSGRRFKSQGERAQDDGFLDKFPHYNTVSKYLCMPWLTHVLTDLIEMTSEPFAAIETEFAIDSTGFGTKTTDTWTDTKYGVRKKKKVWVKLHANVGVKTRTIAAAQVTDIHVHDTMCMEYLLKRTAKRFKIKRQFGDGAYSSHANCDMVSSHGAEPYLMFSKRATRKARGSLTWTRMYDIFYKHREKFFEQYNKRNNVECVFNMIKSKWSTDLRSKKYESQVNELLCKVLCHNIIVLTSELYNLGLTLENVKEQSVLGSPIDVLYMEQMSQVSQEHAHA